LPANVIETAARAANAIDVGAHEPKIRQSTIVEVAGLGHRSMLSHAEAEPGRESGEGSTCLCACNGPFGRSHARHDQGAHVGLLRTLQPVIRQWATARLDPPNMRALRSEDFDAGLKCS
jgi:hypothetical protein